MRNTILRIATMGMPGLVLLVAIDLGGVAAGIALIATLSCLGPVGTVTGIASLSLIGIIYRAISVYGAEQVIKETLREMYKQGESSSSIKRKVKKMPISQSIKNRIYSFID